MFSLFPIPPRLVRPIAPVATAMLLSAALLSAAALPAQAASPLTASEILNRFDAVVLGDARSTAIVEGRTDIGGTLSGGDYTTRIYAPWSTYDELVGGDIGGTIEVDNGDDATIGGSGSGVLETNGGSPAVGGRTVTFGAPVPAPSTGAPGCTTNGSRFPISRRC